MTIPSLQQLEGGQRYGHKTRVGNWSEDWEGQDTQLKDYMKKKDQNVLGINLTQQKFAKSLQRVPQTFSKDGYVRFGDSILLKNKATNGVLVFDQGDKITSHDEAYACTTSGKEVGPCARSVLVISKAEDDGAPDNVLRYGQKIRFESTNYFIKHTYG